MIPASERNLAMIRARKIAADAACERAYRRFILVLKIEAMFFLVAALGFACGSAS